MASEHVKEFTEANWQDEVLSSQQPVLVDFWAPWCGPCRAIAPEIEAVAEANQGKVKVGKVNVEDNGGLAARYHIQSIPALMVFKDGNVAEQVLGIVSRGKLDEMVAKVL